MHRYSQISVTLMLIYSF